MECTTAHLSQPQDHRMRHIRYRPCPVASRIRPRASIQAKLHWTAARLAPVKSSAIGAERSGHSVSTARRAGGVFPESLTMDLQHRPPKHPSHGLQANHCRATGHWRHHTRHETENGRVSSTNAPRQKWGDFPTFRRDYLPSGKPGAVQSRGIDRPYKKVSGFGKPCAVNLTLPENQSSKSRAQG